MAIGSGFKVEFNSGIVLSVIWGNGAYCTMRDSAPLSVEVAIFDKNVVTAHGTFKYITREVFLEMAGVDHLDDSCGWQSPQELKVLMGFLENIDYQRMLKAGRLLA